MIYLKSSVSELGRVQAVYIAKAALKWCERTMGINRRKKYKVKTYVRKAAVGDDTCGEYDCWDNEIYIYWNNCSDVRDLIATCIHEWTHQKQPILTKYYKYPGTYSRNPYERQARYNEMKWTPIAWREMKASINNHLKTL
jgi:hypothetical protein